MHRRIFLKSGAAALMASLGAVGLGRAGLGGSALFAQNIRVMHSGVAAPLPTSSTAYRWIDVMQQAAANDVIRRGARPTILSRAMAMTAFGMYEAWAAYDDRARGQVFGASLRRPKEERTLANRQEAVSFAAAHVLMDVYPEDAALIGDALERMGYDRARAVPSLTSPAGIGTLAAQKLCALCHGDGANQLGDERGSNGVPYSDYTDYAPVNRSDHIYDPDRWQPIPFQDGKGGTFAPGFLTPHWYRVTPFALTSASQFRAPEPPHVASDQLRKEINEVLDFSAHLTPERKAIVEFMRDGPASTGQSGHWMRIAQDVSRRDGNDLETDIKMFFIVGAAASDAFIASWDTKRHYDTSRPWTQVRYYYGDRDVLAWGGPGKGTVTMKGADWYPYSPYSFVSPPFPSYVSGHSTVSAASAEALRLFTGSDDFGAAALRRPGEITEPDAIGSEVQVFLPTFTRTAEIAGISRVYGGYHIQSDNIEGLKMGRSVGAQVYQRAMDLFG